MQFSMFLKRNPSPLDYDYIFLARPLFGESRSMGFSLRVRDKISFTFLEAHESLCSPEILKSFRFCSRLNLESPESDPK